MKKYIFLPLLLLTSLVHSMDNGVTQSVATLADTLTQLSGFLKAGPKAGDGGGGEKPAAPEINIAFAEKVTKLKGKPTLEAAEKTNIKFETIAEAERALNAAGLSAKLSKNPKAKNNELKKFVADSAAPDGGDAGAGAEKPAEPAVKTAFEEKVEKLKGKPSLTAAKKAAEEAGIKFADIAEATKAFTEAGYKPNAIVLQSLVEGGAKPAEPVKKPEPVKNTVVAMKQLGLTLNTLKNMDGSSPANKVLKKAKAREVLNTVLELSSTPGNDEKIRSAVTEILNIDPLLISTAIQVLRNIKVPDEDIYTMITDYYNKAVAKIAKEFKAAKDRLVKSGGFMGGGFAGFCEDIDEALSYPIELESEIQAAKTIVEFHGPTEKEAAAFVAEIKALHQKILQMLKDPAHQKALESCGFDVKFLLNIFEKKERPYCSMKTGWKPTLFTEELNNLIKNINNYQAKKATLSRIERTYTVQSIITMLNGFLDHVTNKSYCQICLRSEIQELAQDMNYANKTFQAIEQFLRTVRDEESNRALTVVIDEILPKLKNAIRNEGCALE